ncbi:hypothetical protein FACS189450_03440 [Spirochaetia bacterium]|nr:hypothetical protein FACS189450_03440 [Spirochaetia bacterium]
MTDYSALMLSKLMTRSPWTLSLPLFNNSNLFFLNIKMPSSRIRQSSADGKAVLLRDDYCDGLGNCLSVYPVNAITFEEREAKEYNQEAVKMNMNDKMGGKPLACGCPGSNAKTILRTEGPQDSAAAAVPVGKTQSRLNQWPVQIKLDKIKAKLNCA